MSTIERYIQYGVSNEIAIDLEKKISLTTFKSTPVKNLIDNYGLTFKGEPIKINTVRLWGWHYNIDPLKFEFALLD